MATDEMGINERDQYLRRMQPQYRQADRRTKKELLDQMVAYTGLHRKSVMRRLRGPLQRQPRCRERAKTYGAEVDAALAVIWETLDYSCPLRLQPNLVSTGRWLAECQELLWSPTLEAQLAQISVGSVQRHLPPRPTVPRPRKVPAPLNRYQQQLPAYRIPRDIAEPGHFELDLVHHCGPVTEGEYVYTLQMIDVATGWGARRAILGRSYVVVADALAYLFAHLPFPVLELHPDNGSEFLNHHLLAFLEREYPEPRCSRSRPGHPNDNRLVEEKNGSLVRHYLGDWRLDTVVQTRYLNTLYEQLNLYHNYILPVLKQIDKQWQPETAARAGYMKRTHDTARPPLERLCDLWGSAYAERCQALRRQRAQVNPRELRRNIYRDLQHLFAYPGATPGQPENVFETLADPERFPEAMVALQALDAVPPAPTMPADPHLPGKELA